MSQGSAAFLDKQESKKSEASKVALVIEHIPVLEAPEAFALFDHLVLRLGEIGEQYSRSIHIATKELMDRVDAAAKTKYALNTVPMTQQRIATARDEFEGKILEAAGLMNTQRQMAIEEVQSLRGQAGSRSQEEITQTESAVEREEIRIQQMVEDVTLDIPVVMRANAANNELKAYLRGLKFRGFDTPSTVGL